MVEFEQPYSVGRATAREIPGDLEIFFGDPAERANSSNRPALTISSVGKNDGITKLGGLPDMYVEPGTEFRVSGTITNRGGTNAGGPLSEPNIDNCDNPQTPDEGGSLSNNGTLINVRSTLEGFTADGPLDIEICMQDADAPSVRTVYNWRFDYQSADTSSGESELALWAEGANSGTRVTPIYNSKITFTPLADGVQTIKPEGFGGGQTEDSNPASDDGSSEPDYSGFDLSNFESSCSITSIEGGTAAEVDIDIEGFLSPRAPEGSREVLIDLLVDGEVLTTGIGSITVNGSNGESFEIRGLERGEYDIGYELRDNGWN